MYHYVPAAAKNLFILTRTVLRTVFARFCKHGNQRASIISRRHLKSLVLSVCLAWKYNCIVESSTPISNYSGLQDCTSIHWHQQTMTANTFQSSLDEDRDGKMRLSNFERDKHILKTVVFEQVIETFSSKKSFSFTKRSRACSDARRVTFKIACKNGNGGVRSTTNRSWLTPSMPSLDMKYFEKIRFS